MMIEKMYGAVATMVREASHDVASVIYVSTIDKWRYYWRCEVVSHVSSYMVSRNEWRYYWRCEVVSHVSSDADTFDADVKLQFVFLTFQLLHRFHIHTHSYHVYTAKCKEVIVQSN